MNLSKPFKTIQNIFARENNAIGSGIGNQFLRHGNQKPLVQDWASVIMSDKDLYTGYSYAAINNRANKTAQLATANLKTAATPEKIKQARAKNELLKHPYLNVIDKSPSFSDYRLWYDISTFIDLEGVYYLMAIRTVQGERVGNVQEFKLLSSYNVRRIRNKATGEIGGYVESRDGLVREIPPQMIIDIRNLNPFSQDEPYAMTDAAKEFQYTLKQAGDYTRHTLKNNMSASGIISTDMMLEDEQFRNFVSRVTNQDKGMPLFGNGSGAITWESMQIDLDKASLDKINEINRSTLMAVSGVGKTMMSIEESGTTRDTAKVQKDLFVEGHIMPQLQLIIDALNQDYKKYYPAEYKVNGYELYIDNPLGTDREAELKDIDIRAKGLELYSGLVNKGYDIEIAAKYAEGEITLEELGQPTNTPLESPIDKALKLKAPAKPDTTPDEPQQNLTDKVKNEFDEETQGLVAIQQSSLQNEINNVEQMVVGAVLNKLTKANNAFEDTNDIISKTQQAEYEKTLQQDLENFYLVLIPIFASLFLAKRAKEFNMLASFKTTPAIKREMKTLSKLVSKSHIDTILEDLRTTIKATYDSNVQERLAVITATGRTVTDSDLVLARKLALEGNGQTKIVSEIKQEYANIAQGRAKTIARTESARAFNQSQYQSDIQFTQQNDLTERAYKKWVTRNDNPCAFCLDMANQPPIPLTQNFLDLGDVFEVIDNNGEKTKVKKMSIDFEPIEAGLLHPNCGCTYRLIVE